MAFDISSATPVEKVTPKGFDLGSASPFTASEEKPRLSDVLAYLPPTRLAMGALSPFIAAAQAGAHVGDVINRLTGVEPVVSPWIDKKLQEYEAAKQRGMKAAGEEGIDWMNLIGSLYPSTAIAKSVTKAVPPAAGLLPKMVEGAKAGAAVSASQPVANEDFWKGKAVQAGGGGVIGGAIPVLGKGAEYLYEKGSAFAQPALDLFRKEGPENFLRRYLREITGEANVPAVQQALRQAKPIVPGSQPTAAEAVSGLPVGSPLQEAQKITAKTSGGPSIKFGQRLNQQIAARKQALERIAPGLTEAQAIEMRQAVTQPLYEAAYRETVRADPTLNLLLKRPSMETAFKQAARIAQEQGDMFVIPGKAATIQTSPILNRIGQPYTVQTAAKATEYPVKSLHYLKLALDDMIRSPEQFALGKTEQRAIAETKSALVKWIADKSPAYNLARSTYEALSNVVNRTQVRDFLKDKLTNPTGVETPGVYLRAIDDATKMLKTATGYPRFKSLSEALPPKEVREVTNLAQDLERKLASMKPLQPTNLTGGVNISKEVMPHLPSVLSRPVVISNWLLNKLGKASIEPRIDALATELYLNPSQLADVLSRAPVAHPQVQRLLGGLSQVGTVGLPLAFGQAQGAYTPTEQSLLEYQRSLQGQP